MFQLSFVERYRNKIRKDDPILQENEHVKMYFIKCCRCLATWFVLYVVYFFLGI